MSLRRLARLTRRTLLCCGVLFAAPSQGRADATLESATWLQRIQDFYRHYDAVQLTDRPVYPGRFEPRCDVMKGRLTFEPWTISLHLQKRGRDKDLFYSDLYLAVRKLRGTQDAMAVFAEASKRSVRGNLDLPECMSSYHYDALIQAGQYLITVDASCSQLRTLFVYEVADVVRMLREAGLTVAACTVFNLCGVPELELVDTDWLLKEAKRPRRLYQHRLPDEREQVKQKAAAAVPPATQSELLGRRQPP